MTVARQRAELLALRSQINPHFLFNTLESIRMHSILKKEYVTAGMIEKLAVLERQYVDWGADFASVEEETELVKAYLGIQKYRFGDRIAYEIDIEDKCKNMIIPKLSVVTFVENACVHGIESKKVTAGFLYVYILKTGLCILKLKIQEKAWMKKQWNSFYGKCAMQAYGFYRERSGLALLMHVCG